MRSEKDLSVSAFSAKPKTTDPPGRSQADGCPPDIRIHFFKSLPHKYHANKIEPPLWGGSILLAVGYEKDVFMPLWKGLNSCPILSEIFA